MRLIQLALLGGLLVIPAGAAEDKGVAADQGAISQPRPAGQPNAPQAQQRLQMQQRMQAQRGAQAQPGAQPKQPGDWAKTHPPKDHWDLVPLTDLGKGQYQGEQGGLYPDGENVPPPAHLQAGLKLAQQIVPLNAEGQKAGDGKIVFLSVGFSNTSLEFNAFVDAAGKEKDLNPRLVVLNGAIGMQPAQAAADPKSDYWKAVDQRLSKAGVTPKQVQVLWVKETFPGPHDPFPAEARKLQGLLVQVMNTCQDRFLNVKMAYLASRIYAGYSIVGGNPEPWAYEFAFSAKWLIADQVAGKPELNCDPAKGAVRSPWLAWGPYLWADGAKGRKDGLVWLREDLTDRDGMHPSDKGCEKVVKLMMDFFRSDPTARPWFVKPQ